MTAGRAEWGYKMTATLLVVVPVVLLLLIGSFCFVGCTLDTHGLGLGFVQYSDLDIVPNPDCVAYWPLSDSPFQSTALDVVGKAHGDPHNGTYKNVNNVSGADADLFPIPDFNPSPTNHSADAPGTQTIGAPGIVTGDTVPPHDPKNPISTTCMQCDGGFVSVDANVTCNPPVFSVECWAQPEWNASDAPATRRVIDSTDATAVDGFGYAIGVDLDGKWSGSVGNSGAGNAFVVAVGGTAELNKPAHLVLTFDGSNASLFVNGALAGSVAVPAFAPNTTKPLVIGVGGPFLDKRVKGVMEPPPRFPFLPFKGKIQDVAIYKAVLDDTTIMNHSEHGQGNATG